MPHCNGRRGSGGNSTRTLSRAFWAFLSLVSNVSPRRAPVLPQSKSLSTTILIHCLKPKHSFLFLPLLNFDTSTAVHGLLVCVQSVHPSLFIFPQLLPLWPVSTGLPKFSYCCSARPASPTTPSRGKPSVFLLKACTGGECWTQNNQG